MKKTFAILLALVMLFSLAACGSSNTETGATATEATPKVIRFGHSYDATTLDPQRATDDGSYFVINNVSEGLVVGLEGSVQPGLAESWDVSEDGTVYTFHLRESVWSDGTPLTANDFVYAAKRILDPNGAFDNTYNFYVLKNGESYNLGECAFEDVGVKALDDYTLEYTLAHPDATFLFSLGGYGWAPLNRTACEQYGETYGAEAENLLTNGPFTVTEWLHDSKITIEKNPNYWNTESVKIDRVEFVIGAADQVAVDLFTAGELDYAIFTKQVYVDALNALGLPSVEGMGGSNFLWMNCSGGSDATAAVMSNANFRNAISCAIDREAVMNACGIMGTPTNRIAAPSLKTVSGKSWDEEYPVEGWSVNAEPEKAMEYLNLALEELGITADEIPELTMVCFDSQSNMTKLQAIQDMIYQTLGVNCVISPQPIQQMFALVDAGEFDFWVGGKVVEVPDWLAQIGFEFSDGLGAVGGYTNTAYHELFHAAEYAPTQEVREPMVYELEQIIIEDMTTLHLFWNRETTFTSEGLTGVVFMNDDTPYFAACEYVG